MNKKLACGIKEHVQIRRILQTRYWLAHGADRALVRSRLVKKYNVSVRQAYRYIKHANSWDTNVISTLRKNADLFRGQALTFFDAVILNPDSTIKEKINAWKGKLSVLWSLENRFVVEHRGRVSITGELDVNVRALIAEMQRDRRIREDFNLIDDNFAISPASAPCGGGNGVGVHVPGAHGSNGNAGEVRDAQAHPTPRPDPS